MDNLFGPTPYQVEQLQQARIGQAADRFAEQSPFAKASGLLYRGGAGLAQTGAGMLGMVNPEVEQAKQTERIMGDGQADLTTSKGWLDKAKQFAAAGDTRTATMLFLKGKQLEKEEAAMAIAARRTDIDERKANDMDEFRKMQLIQMAEAAKQRSEDTRLGIQQRAEAAREANQIRLEIAKLAAANKQVGQMTPAQLAKQQASMAKSEGALRQMDTDLSTLKEEANAIKTSPGLSGVTGVKGVFPSYPGGESAKAEALLSGFKDRVKLVGLNLVRQGGGIGAMTEKEWPIVEGMVANIDPVKLGKQGTIEAIDKVVAKMEQFLNNARVQHSESFGDMSKFAPALEFRTPEEVRGAYKAGKIDRESAKAILKDMGV